MALYAMGDMHLSFAVDKPMDRFGSVWKNHEAKIEKHCRSQIRPDDTFVVTGDHSWGRKMTEAEPDLAFIAGLPGKKILLRGNHDMFWDAKKTEALNARFASAPQSDNRDMFRDVKSAEVLSAGGVAAPQRDSQSALHFLQNNFYTYRDYALVGTKGYTFEGPFRVNMWGQILDWNKEDEEQAKKLVKREAERLRISFEAAEAAGYTKYIMFLHYPPTNVLQTESVFTRMAEEYGAAHVVYSHCHGRARFGDSIRGDYHGIHYHLVSGDYLGFRPEKILE